MICSESKEQVEEKLESRIHESERRGVKVRRKAKHMCVNERQVNGTVRMQRGGESGGFQILGINCTK